MSQGIKYFIGKIEDKYPFTFIDVGAMGGIPLKWDGVSQTMKIIAFEPDPREFSQLKSKKNITYFNYALHDKSQDLKFYIAKEPGKSSIFEPDFGLLSEYENVERFQVIKEELIPEKRVKDLDSVIKENSIPDVDFIKLDTQGSELLILEGGQRKLIPQIFSAQIEAEFIPMYKNQPLFRDIDDFMNRKGFTLIDLRRAYWKKKDYYLYPGKGQLVFGDCLYFKKIDCVYEELSGLSDKSYGKGKIFKNILTCLVYKMFDYAVALARAGNRLGYLTDSECEQAKEQIKKISENRLFLTFSLNRRLYNTINSIVKKFKPLSYLGWADSDNEIGNIKDI